MSNGSPGMSRRHNIIATAIDAARDLAYYDRKDDEELGVGDIEDAIAAGEVTIAEIVASFEAELRTALGPRVKPR